MHIKLSGHHIELTPALKDYVNTKFKKLEHHIIDITNAEVVLEVEKLRHIAKANIHVKGENLHAEYEDGDMYAAIDKLFDKLERQGKKHKETK